MDQPQPCTKCNTLPEDILMLACSHDLCLNCAADRLNFQMKKRKPANSIVCEFCYQRTPLDAESISELQKLIPSQQTQPKNLGRSYLDKTNDNKYDRYTNEKSIRANDESQFRQREREREKPLYEKAVAAREYSLSGSNSQMFAGISSRKSCGEHPDEDILYFCFTCKVECICPQCVIHGKHKDHDVKTIKKSHPLVKSELESSLDKIESNIQNLLIKKSQIQKNIRTLNEQNSLSKRQIQQAFEQIRSKIDIQERELLSRCDSQLNQSIEQLQKSTKSILRRIQELKAYSTGTVEFMKKDEQTMLNFYAKKWKEISEQTKQQNINVSTVSLPNNQRTLGLILDLTEQIDRIGAVIPSRK